MDQRGLAPSSMLADIWTTRDDFSIKSFTGKVLLAVSHRASFWMVQFTGPGLDPYMEAARGVVSHPIPLES
jgi:hypothetical protein